MKSILVTDTVSSCMICDLMVDERPEGGVEFCLPLKMNCPQNGKIHPRCPLVQIDLEEIEEAVLNIGLHFDTCEEKICQVVNYDNSINIIKDLLTKLGGK